MAFWIPIALGGSAVYGGITAYNKVVNGWGDTGTEKTAPLDPRNGPPNRGIFDESGGLVGSAVRVITSPPLPSILGAATGGFNFGKLAAVGIAAAGLYFVIKG